MLLCDVTLTMSERPASPSPACGLLISRTMICCRALRHLPPPTWNNCGWKLKKSKTKELHQRPPQSGILDFNFCAFYSTSSSVKHRFI